MNWKIKALVQNSLSILPFGLGDSLHYRLQYSKGKLRPKSMYDTAKAFYFMDRITKHRSEVSDVTVFELGSGWALQIPLCLWLCGINKIITVDLNRHFRPEFTHEYISYWSENEEEFFKTAGKYAKSAVFQERYGLLLEGASNPEKLMSDAGIEYRSPYDARQTDLPTNSVDMYYSTNVLEHVPEQAIVEILKEQNRILKSDGIAVHRVNPGDHFSFFDSSISSVNFLKYSDFAWKLWAGNKFAYHNRLRFSDYLDLFRMAECEPFEVLEQAIDEKAFEELENNFTIHSKFKGKSNKDLATLGFILEC